MNAKRLEEKDPGETVPLTWDFTDDIAGIGDFNIAGIPEIVCVVDNSLRRNADPSPSDMVNSTPDVTDKIVAQSITGGVHGVDYKITCKVAIDSTPESLLFKTSILPVRRQ